MGKSEAAEYILDCLNRCGEKAEWYEENDCEHPADYTFHAYIRSDQLKKLDQEERMQLYNEGMEVLSGLVIPLTKISVSLFEKILPYKIYDRLDWEMEKPVMLDRWLQFSQMARAINQIFIFEGAFFQNPICETLLRFDFDISEIKAYIKTIYQTISDIKPIVVYLDCSDVKDCVENVCRHRNGCWVNKMIDTYTCQGYARNNGLTGIDGYIACLERRRCIEREILNELPCAKLILNDSYKNHGEMRQSIDAFMKENM